MTEPIDAAQEMRLHYAIEDLEDLQTTLEQLQIAIKAATEHPADMPLINRAAYFMLASAVNRHTGRNNIRNEEMERLGIGNDPND